MEENRSPLRPRQDVTQIGKLGTDRLQRSRDSMTAAAGLAAHELNLADAEYSYTGILELLQEASSKALV